MRAQLSGQPIDLVQYCGAVFEQNNLQSKKNLIVSVKGGAEEAPPCLKGLSRALKLVKTTTPPLGIFLRRQGTVEGRHGISSC